MLLDCKGEVDINIQTRERSGTIDSRFGEIRKKLIHTHTQRLKCIVYRYSDVFSALLVTRAQNLN